MIITRLGEAALGEDNINFWLLEYIEVCVGGECQAKVCDHGTSLLILIGHCPDLFEAAASPHTIPKGLDATISEISRQKSIENMPQFFSIQIHRMRAPWWHCADNFRGIFLLQARSL